MSLSLNIKQYDEKITTKDGAMQKVCHSIELFVTLCQFSSNTTPVLFIKLLKETIEWEIRRLFFVYDCFSLSRCIKGGKKSDLETQLSFCTYMLYKQPTLTK